MSVESILINSVIIGAFYGGGLALRRWLDRGRGVDEAFSDPGASVEVDCVAPALTDEGFWRLVLACGYAEARKCVMPSVGTMFRPLEEKLTPKRCQCPSCGYGHAKIDPWVMIKAFGWPTL